jgi:hypothetical protein
MTCDLLVRIDRTQRLFDTLSNFCPLIGMINLAHLLDAVRSGTLRLQACEILGLGIFSRRGSTCLLFLFLHRTDLHSLTGCYAVDFDANRLTGAVPTGFRSSVPKSISEGSETGSR